jgi:hypothetical protein
LPALFIALFAVSLAGTGWFAVPHPLHNVFGLSATVGYLSPLVLALAWRGKPVPYALTTVSAVAWLLVTAAIALNLSPLVTPTLYPLEYYGLVQRALFLAFYGWCTYLSLALYVDCRRAPQRANLNGISVP